MTNLYYEAPSDTSFEDMKKACMDIWDSMSNDGGYRDEKISRIKDIKNIQDNFMYMFCGFDINNQRRVVSLLEASTIEDIRVRMKAGGNDWITVESVLGV